MLHDDPWVDFCSAWLCNGNFVPSSTWCITGQCCKVVTAPRAIEAAIFEIFQHSCSNVLQDTGIFWPMGRHVLTFMWMGAYLWGCICIGSMTGHTAICSCVAAGSLETFSEAASAVSMAKLAASAGMAATLMFHECCRLQNCLWQLSLGILPKCKTVQLCSVHCNLATQTWLRTFAYFDLLAASTKRMKSAKSYDFCTVMLWYLVCKTLPLHPACCGVH